MYNTREQVNLDLHEGLKRVSEIVGGNYRLRVWSLAFFLQKTCDTLQKRRDSRLSGKHLEPVRG